jgi:hypothetical protein
VKIKLCCLVLLLGSSAFMVQADTADASGYYAVSGSVTMTGILVGPCGNSPCVENIDFSFLMSVVTVGGDLSEYYVDRIVAGPGITSTSGPLGTSFDMYIDPAEDLGYLGFVSNTAPFPEIDVFNFNTLFGVPHSSSGIGNAFFYVCSGSVSEEFGCSALGSQMVNVRQIPEPSSFMLIVVGLVALSALALSPNACRSFGL